MSQYTVNLTYRETPASASIGFDNRLEQFFIDFYENGEMVYTSLSEMDYRDNLFLASKLAELEIPLPRDLYVELTLAAAGFQKTFGTANATATYDVSAVSPLQAQLLQMHGLQVITPSIGDVSKMKVLWVLMPEREEPKQDVPVVWVETQTIEFVVPKVLATAAGIPEHGGVLSDEALLEALHKMAPAWETMRVAYPDQDPDQESAQ